MNSRIFRLLTIYISLTVHPLMADNVGLLVVATGKYINFVKPLVESAEKYFCNEHDVTYFIFTDSLMPPTENIVWIYHPRIGWPFDTMLRNQAYAGQKDLLSQQDYLFACDADMLFIDEVGSEILSDRVGTQHPGFVWQRGSYETSPLSLACVNSDEGEYYFAGGFFGGSSEEVLKLCETTSRNVDMDLSHGIIAVWHDESHLNRYFIDHPPTKILTPSYCYPESWNLPYPKKLLALDKNHSEYRQ